MNFDSFECISFDCYGTLIDWETGLLSALTPVLKAHGASLDGEELLELYARIEAGVESGRFRPYREVLKTVLSKIGDTLEFKPTFRELEDFPESVKTWPPFADSKRALNALGCRHRLVVLSNVDRELFRYSQALLEIDFDAVFTSEDVGSYKPSLGNFEYLIRNAGVPKEKILHVAQSLFHDIAPAKRMGLKTVWVNRRMGKRGFGATPPAGATPDLTVKDLEGLCRIAGVNL